MRCLGDAGTSVAMRLCMTMQCRRVAFFSAAFALVTLLAPRASAQSESPARDAIETSARWNDTGNTGLALDALREVERTSSYLEGSEASRLRLARRAIGWRLDPRLALTLSGDRVEEIAGQLDALDAERAAAIAVGITSAATGVASLLTMLIAVVESVQCTVVVVLPICGPTDLDDGVMTGAAVLGVSSLSLAVTSMLLLVDAGARSGRLEASLRVSGSASNDGGHLAISGAF